MMALKKCFGDDAAICTAELPRFVTMPLELFNLEDTFSLLASCWRTQYAQHQSPWRIGQGMGRRSRSRSPKCPGKVVSKMSTQTCYMSAIRNTLTSKIEKGQETLNCAYHILLSLQNCMAKASARLP